jgi:TPR repeat protein
LLDPDSGKERRLSFEFQQRRLELIRDQNLLVFPLARLIAAREVAEEGVRDSVKPPPGVPRTLEYLDEFPPDQQAARMKALIADNGPSIPDVLARYCFSRPDAGCSTAAVDALLPLAEQRRAEPMILLAFAQANGLGVKGDESAAKVLLQGATRHESTGAVYASYLELDGSHVPDAKPFERWVYTQVSAAADAGDKLAAGVALQFAASNSDYERDASRLQRWQREADAVGLTDFTYNYCVSVAQKTKDGPAAIRCAEGAGKRRYSALALAKAYERGDLPDVPADPAKGLYWRRQAAVLGDPASMRIIGRHYAAESMKPESLVLARKWYMSALVLFDSYAALDLARLEADGKLDPVGGPKAAKTMYEAILKANPGELGPSTRRGFAELLATGKGIEHDPNRARALLMQDADSGDPYSQLALANMLYAGSLGARDLKSANNWIEKALSANKATVTIAIADELYKGVRLDPDRERAISLWMLAAQQQGGELAWNDMAWELCTGPDANLRDPKRGLEAAIKATSKNASSSWRDTLAACQAAVGDFVAATASELRALADSDPDSDLATNLRTRIELYRNHQGYVQQPYNSSVTQQQ